MADLLKKSWWALLVRGLATMLLGVIALAQPNVMTLVVTFVVFALVDGIAGVVGSIMNRKEDERWWLAALRGLVGIAPGVLVLVQPQLGALRLLQALPGLLRVIEELPQLGAEIGEQRLAGRLQRVSRAKIGVGPERVCLIDG